MGESGQLDKGRRIRGSNAFGSGRWCSMRRLCKM